MHFRKVALAILSILSTSRTGSEERLLRKEARGGAMGMGKRGQM